MSQDTVYNGIKANIAFSIHVANSENPSTSHSFYWPDVLLGLTTARTQVGHKLVIEATRIDNAFREQKNIVGVVDGFIKQWDDDGLCDDPEFNLYETPKIAVGSEVITLANNSMLQAGWTGVVTKMIETPKEIEVEVTLPSNKTVWVNAKHIEVVTSV